VIARMLFSPDSLRTRSDVCGTTESMRRITISFWNADRSLTAST
jgi:hypothetical protein